MFSITAVTIICRWWKKRKGERRREKKREHDSAAWIPSEILGKTNFLCCVCFEIKLKLNFCLLKVWLKVSCWQLWTVGTPASGFCASPRFTRLFKSPKLIYGSGIDIMAFANIFLLPPTTFYVSWACKRKRQIIILEPLKEITSTGPYRSCAAL